MAGFASGSHASARMRTHNRGVITRALRLTMTIRVITEIVAVVPGRGVGIVGVSGVVDHIDSIAAEDRDPLADHGDVGSDSIPVDLMAVQAADLHAVVAGVSRVTGVAVGGDAVGVGGQTRQI